MDYRTFIDDLRINFEESFKLSQEIAKMRDNKLIEGFINMALEETSFNDFYSSGNENILKYSGVVFGLEKKEYAFFQSLTEEYSKKLIDLSVISKELIAVNEDNNETFNRFKVGAEYCLIDFIDEKIKYINLDNRPIYYKILSESNQGNTEPYLLRRNMKELHKLIQKGEESIKNTLLIYKMLQNPTYQKKNAYYAVKRFDWMHEKGTFDGMSDLEMKNFYNRIVTKEKSTKNNFLFAQFDATEKFNFVNLNLSS